MIYKSKHGEIDLTKVTRLYPAVVVDMQGEVAEMSLEWFELYGEKIKFISFVLVFDYTSLGEEEKIRKVLKFDNRNELIETMKEVSKLFQK